MKMDLPQVEVTQAIEAPDRKTKQRS